MCSAGRSWTEWAVSCHFYAECDRPQSVLFEPIDVVRVGPSGGVARTLYHECHLRVIRTCPWAAAKRPGSRRSRGRRTPAGDSTRSLPREQVESHRLQLYRDWISFVSLCCEPSSLTSLARMRQSTSEAAPRVVEVSFGGEDVAVHGVARSSMWDYHPAGSTTRRQSRGRLARSRL